MLITEGEAQGNLLALYYLYVHMSVHTYGEQYMYIHMFVPLVHALVCTFMDMSACTSNLFPLCPEYCFLNLPVKGVRIYLTHFCQIRPHFCSDKLETCSIFDEIWEYQSHNLLLLVLQNSTNFN